MLITTIYTLSSCGIMYVFEGEALRIFTQIHYAHVMLDRIIPAYLSLVLMQSLVGTIGGLEKYGDDDSFSSESLYLVCFLNFHDFKNCLKY